MAYLGQGPSRRSDEEAGQRRAFPFGAGGPLSCSGVARRLHTCFQVCDVLAPWIRPKFRPPI